MKPSKAQPPPFRAAHEKKPPSEGRHRALGIFLLKGPRGALFLMSEVPLYLQTHEVGVELEEFLQVDAEPPRDC